MEEALPWKDARIKTQMWKNEVGHEEKKIKCHSVQLQKVIVSKHFSLILNLADFAGGGRKAHTKLNFAVWIYFLNVSHFFF